ncbi:uncharacterized protein LOC131233861 [Magnolia sinica]|uniref:uncharacterized protein LOC131233861 n=1 Tax=Magnolia sinica TaxID=86752 RepID=UPI00265A8B3F|nr:uncharacterized protein LOC131233861 [Magnolia sinica]
MGASAEQKEKAVSETKSELHAILRTQNLMGHAYVGEGGGGGLDGDDQTVETKDLWVCNSAYGDSNRRLEFELNSTAGSVWDMSISVSFCFSYFCWILMEMIGRLKWKIYGLSFSMRGQQPTA